MGNLGEWQREREANTKCQQSKAVMSGVMTVYIMCHWENVNLQCQELWLFWKFILIYTAFCYRFVDKEDNNDNKGTYKISDAQLNCSPPTNWCPASSWAVATTNLPKLPQQSFLVYSNRVSSGTIQFYLYHWKDLGELWVHRKGSLPRVIPFFWGGWGAGLGSKWEKRDWKTGMQCELYITCCQNSNTHMSFSIQFSLCIIRGQAESFQK